MLLGHRRWRLIVFQFGLLGITAQQQVVRLLNQHVQRVVIADNEAAIANIMITVLLLVLMMLMPGGHRRQGRSIRSRGSIRRVIIYLIQRRLHDVVRYRT